jgi:tetratricopeptide (TPR) repeat protein
METEIDVLLARTRRYPADRYPAQHATAQFHLGSALLQTADAPRALAALDTAEQLFAGIGMRSEHAKSLLMHGTGLRVTGRPREALRRFEAAADLFADLGQAAEEAAARHNIGLVLVETGDAAEALEAFGVAQQLFRAAGQRVWAGAAAREQGALLLGLGEPAAAVPLLEEAVELSGEADPAGAGATANVLGLAHLELGCPEAAVGSLQLSLAWHPRSVRPAEHAMAKANLALAHEAAGATAQARLTARHALSVPEAPEPVRAQSAQVLGRLEGGAGWDLGTVLDQEPRARWDIWVRDEMLRWTELDQQSRDEEAAAWLQGQDERGADGVELAQALLGVLLELPPSAYDLVISSIVRAVAATDPHHAERLQAVFRSAMARYPLPQWQRMAETFSAAAEREGQVQQWR